MEQREWKVQVMITACTSSLMLQRPLSLVLLPPPAPPDAAAGPPSPPRAAYEPPRVKEEPRVAAVAAAAAAGAAVAAIRALAAAVAVPSTRSRICAGLMDHGRCASSAMSSARAASLGGAPPARSPWSNHVASPPAMRKLSVCRRNMYTQRCRATAMAAMKWRQGGGSAPSSCNCTANVACRHSRKAG